KRCLQCLRLAATRQVLPAGGTRPGAPGCLPLDAPRHGPEKTREPTTEPTASRHPLGVPGVESANQRPDAAHLTAVSTGQPNPRVHPAHPAQRLPGRVATTPSLWPVAP